MLEGFETKSADPVKNTRRKQKLKEIADIGSIQQSLVKHFSDIKDNRVERTKKHQLIDILVNCNFSNHSWSARVGSCLTDKTKLPSSRRQ